MNQIKFTRDIEFNNDGNFFDDHPHESSFYENSYLAINPNLHDEDAPEKIKVTKEAIQYLILRYNFNPRKIIDIGSGSTLILKNILDFVQSANRNNPMSMIFLGLKLYLKIKYWIASLVTLIFSGASSSCRLGFIARYEFS